MSTEKNRTMRGATMKAGRARQAKVVAVENRSSPLLGRRATTRASGTATQKAIVWEMITSSTSMGRALAMRVTTVSWVTKDWPRFPRKTLPSQMKYCS